VHAGRHLSGRGPYAFASCDPAQDRQGRRLQSSDEMKLQNVRLVVPFVQRQPGGAELRFESLASGEPFAEKRGLAMASRAEMRVNLRPRPWSWRSPLFGRSISRGRETNSGRVGGIRSFAERSECCCMTVLHVARGWPHGASVSCCRLAVKGIDFLRQDIVTRSWRRGQTRGIRRKPLLQDALRPGLLEGQRLLPPYSTIWPR